MRYKIPNHTNLNMSATWVGLEKMDLKLSRKGRAMTRPQQHHPVPLGCPLSIMVALKVSPQGEVSGRSPQTSG